MSAEQGNDEAQNDLAEALYYGLYGLEEDEVEGVNLFRKAAEQGNIDAQIQFGRIYTNGKGDVSLSEAIKWLNKAIEQNKDYKSEEAQELLNKITGGN